MPEAICNVFSYLRLLLCVDLNTKAFCVAVPLHTFNKLQVLLGTHMFITKCFEL